MRVHIDDDKLLLLSVTPLAHVAEGLCIEAKVSNSADALPGHPYDVT